MRRPSGITWLAVLLAMSSALQFLLGIGTLLGWLPLPVRVAPRNVQTVATVLVVVGGVGMSVSIGLWRLKDWARQTAIVLVAVGLSISIFLLLSNLRALSSAEIVRRLVRIALGASLFWYLLRPEVAAAFAQTTAPRPDSPESIG